MMANPNPNEVAIKIKALLEEGQPRFRKECCIYRVPHDIRKHNEEAYTPKVVSIGPFHHGNQNLLNMEGHKRLYCKEFIERSETKNFESLVSCVQELEAEVRSCYSDDIKLSKEELVMVIFVDCCFILQFLREFFFMATTGDPLSLPQRLVNSICSDLLLVENQVPFFVLEKLYNLAFPSTLSSGNRTHPVLLLALAILPDKIITGYRDNVKYSRIFKKLNAFCAHPYHKKVASLRRNYCSTPWKTAASIAGIFLLILTVIQTVFSILQVVQ